MKKIICTALLSGMLTVQAAALPEMGALYAKSAALYAANGQELYVYNADEQLQPASVTDHDHAAGDGGARARRGDTGHHDNRQ